MVRTTSFFIYILLFASVLAHADDAADAADKKAAHDVAALAAALNGSLDAFTPPAPTDFPCVEAKMEQLITPSYAGHPEHQLADNNDSIPQAGQLVAIYPHYKEGEFYGFCSASLVCSEKKFQAGECKTSDLAYSAGHCSHGDWFDQNTHKVAKGFKVFFRTTGPNGKDYPIAGFVTRGQYVDIDHQVMVNGKMQNAYNTGDDWSIIKLEKPIQDFAPIPVTAHPEKLSDWPNVTVRGFPHFFAGKETKGTVRTKEECRVQNVPVDQIPNYQASPLGVKTTIVTNCHVIGNMSGGSMTTYDGNQAWFIGDNIDMASTENTVTVPGNKETPVGIHTSAVPMIPHLEQAEANEDAPLDQQKDDI